MNEFKRKSQSMKISILSLIVFSLIFSGDAFGQGKEPDLNLYDMGIELGLSGVGIMWGSEINFFPGGMLSFGTKSSKGFGVEFGILASTQRGVVVLGNFMVEPFNLGSFVPYLMVGGGLIATSEGGGLMSDIGGGIRFKITRRFDLRTEFNFWFARGESPLIVRAGLSFNL
jgi:hypothetical protein